MAKLSEESKHLTLKVNIDTEDAVRSLKSLQRKARDVAKELRGLERREKTASYVDSMDEPVQQALKRFSTKELTDELASRNGVKQFVVYPNGTMDISIDNQEEGEQERFTGPAIILVNQD